MTAEIAIMNKGAIALAADSAVTIGAGNKTYNTANKLFMLSKFCPVGIMIYGNAELMGYPWETLIKIYRNRLGENSFNTVNDYADSFIQFLEQGNIITKDEQLKHFKRKVSGYYEDIKNDISEEIRTITEAHICKITKPVLSKIVNATIRKHFEIWHKIDFIDKTDNNHCNFIAKEYSNVIGDIIKHVFQELPINKVNNKRLSAIATYIFCKKRYSENNTGVVIAGFGNNENFPSLVEYNIEGIFENVVKFRQNNVSITTDLESTVTAFAQDEMVRTFMEGIDPYFNSSINGYINKAFEEYNKIVIGHFQGSQQDKSDFESKLTELSNKISEEFVKGMRNYSTAEHINPVMEAVGVLPKEEIAIMAESLVNITSFKRKMTLDIESVGGPIDVAVISKGDGFVWVKRKHYFSPELNHAYFSNYFRGTTGGNNGKKN